MSDLPRIDGRESLHAWLETRPRDDAVTVAHRAAMRVAPIWIAAMADDWARERDLTPVPVLRLNLTSGVARKYPTPEVRAAADAAARATARAAAARAAATRAAATFFAAADTAAAARAAPFNAADAATRAATAAAFAIPDTADSWTAVAMDVHALIEGRDLLTSPLWPGRNPLAEIWSASIPILKDTPGGDFWFDWYQSALDGRPQNWPLLRDVALIDNALWKQGGEALDAEITRLVGSHGAQAATPLSLATPVEFDFDEHLQQMQIVGIVDDIAHLDDPLIVAAFVADAEELRDGLQDFLDFVADLPRTSNEPRRTPMAVEKLLKELSRCQSAQSVRARRLIMLAKTFADMAVDDAERQWLGAGLTNMVDSQVSLLRSICRKHLAPSLERMRPLLSLELGDEDPDELLRAAQRLADLMARADNTELARLSPEARAVIEDFIEELRLQRGALADASSPERREGLRKRFAEVYGAVAVAYGHYVEKGKPHVERASAAVDWVIRQYKRWTSFEQIADTIRDCPCKDLP